MIFSASRRQPQWQLRSPVDVYSGVASLLRGPRHVGDGREQGSRRRTNGRTPAGCSHSASPAWKAMQCQSALLTTSLPYLTLPDLTYCCLREVQVAPSPSPGLGGWEGEIAGTS